MNMYVINCAGLKSDARKKCKPSMSFRSTPYRRATMAPKKQSTLMINKFFVTVGMFFKFVSL